ncbi:MAG: hypothetical protein LBS41_02160 [Streptococcaceae bacterium]|jgi:hypothetical protein|nr:hypothetical protein [Streptococcaceae bacterium]
MKKRYVGLGIFLLMLGGFTLSQQADVKPKQTKKSTATPQDKASPQSDVWASKAAAIKFYEKVVKNTANQKLISIDSNNYSAAQWQLETQGQDDITLHYTNIGGAGGSYLKLLKDDEHVKMLNFYGNASFPGQPTHQFIVRISDGLIIEDQSDARYVQEIQTIPAALIGTWQSDDGTISYVLQSNAIVFNDKTCTIEKIEAQQRGGQHTIYTMTFSLQDFKEKYGESSVGIGSQPFIFDYDNTNQTIDVGVVLHKR